MRIQYLNGGLANQVFQYIFYRYAQLEKPGEDVWFLDDSFFFFKKEHNGYELEKVFGLKPNLLSRQFEPKVWEMFIENRKNGIGTAQTMKNLGFDIAMVSEAANYKKDNSFWGQVYTIPCNEYYPEILDVSGEILYYFGYWINKGWFRKYQHIFWEELSFPAISDEKNLAYASQIKNSLSCGIHIRCGDFISYGWALPPEYYHNCVKNIVAERPEVTFFVFSDDISYVREHEEAFGLSLAKGVVYVEGNVEGENYRDMQLLSMCRGMIMSNSSFCYLAALLNRNLEFYFNPVEYRQL